MGLRGCGAIAVFLLMAGLVRSQNLGQGCGRRDGTKGICQDIKDCVTNQNGHVESANQVDVCDSSSLTRIIACCRTTPDIIAEAKCNEWKIQANADLGPFCKVNIPLARGGTQADKGEFPHIVSLLRQSRTDGRLSHICGGVLISNDYVLTAAHCLDNSVLVVRIGGHDLRDSEPGVTVDATVDSQIPHPQYQQPRRYNDIALLKLRIAVTFSKRIRPACLPISNSRIQGGAKLVVAGWGKYKNGGTTSNVLRKAEVTAIDRFTCDNNQDLDRSSLDVYPVGITDSIICGDESNQGACSGDSGGPLMEPTRSQCDVKEVIGLVSRGIPECKATNVPGIYTSIHYYLDWIVGTVWPDEL